MAIDLSAIYTITAPSGVDGFGEIAVLNDPTSANFVGYLEDLSFGLEVRENADDKVEAHGGVHGPFWHGRLPFTMEISLEEAATWPLSNARYEKLRAACNAMAAPGSVVWTEQGRAATKLLFVEQQSPRASKDGRVMFQGVSANRLILASTATTGAPGSGLTNAGKAATFPTFTFTSGASGTVVLSRTSPSPTESLTLTIGGTNGLAASTSTTVDFAARTVYQGSTFKNSAIAFPSSVWWAMAPGANTISASGASSVSISWFSAWLP